RRARRALAARDARQRALEREPLRELRQRSARGTREERPRALVRDRARVLKAAETRAPLAPLVQKPPEAREHESSIRMHGRPGILRVLRRAWVEYERDRARYLAAAMAYYAFVSLVPLLLLLLSGLGLLLRFSDEAAEAQRQVLEQIEIRFGSEVHATIESLLYALQQESIGATVLAVAGLLLSASVLFRHLRLSFRAIWKRDPPLIAGRVGSVVRQTLLERAVSFVMVLGGGALLLAALALMAVSQWIARALGGLPLLGWIE